MTPNDMPTRLAKLPRKPRRPRPIRNTALADQLRQRGLAK